MVGMSYPYINAIFFSILPVFVLPLACRFAFGYLLLSYSLPILDQQTYRDPTDALMPFYAFKRTKKGPNKLLNAPQRKENQSH